MRTITLENGKKVQISEESYNNLQKAVQDIRYKPEYGEEYYFIDNAGSIIINIWENDSTDNYRYQTRNVFKTKVEATEKFHIIKKKFEIINRIEELNEGWKPDWKHHNKDKFYIYYGAIDKTWNIDSVITLMKHPNEFYLKSREIGRQLIKEFGDDLKCLFIT